MRRARKGSTNRNPNTYNNQNEALTSHLREHLYFEAAWETRPLGFLEWKNSLQMSSIIMRRRKLFRSARVVTRGGRIVTKRWSVPKKAKTTTEDKRVFDEPPLLHVDRISDAIIPDTELKSSVIKEKYTTEKQKRLHNWKTLRQPFLSLGRSLFAPELKCFVCMQETENIFRCLDCFQWEVLCLNCLQQRHSDPHLHLFEGWKRGTFLTYQCPTPVWKHHSYCDDPNCQYGKDVVVIDDKGRQHVRTLTFCRCEEESLGFLRYSLMQSDVVHGEFIYDVKL